MAKKNVMLNVVFLNGAEGSVGATGGTSGGSKYDAVMMDGMTFRNNTDISSLSNYTIDASKMTHMKSTFENCSNLTSSPKFVNTSNVTNMFRMYYACSNLTSVPPLDTSNVTHMGYMFDNCKNLTQVPLLDTSKVKIMTYMCNNCSNLTSVSLLDTSNVTHMAYMFYACSNLTTVTQLDMSNVTNMNYMLTKCTALRFMKIINLGKSTLATFEFSGATNWGTGSEENRQSLIDSLITYSYDRAGNGLGATAIKLSDNTKALLTEEEIAQITAKGFTIS